MATLVTVPFITHFPKSDNLKTHFLEQSLVYTKYDKQLAYLSPSHFYTHDRHC